MATGDQADFVSRLKATIPRGWFPDVAPIRDAVLSGLANAHAGVYALIQYAAAQTRIGTATDGFLDLISLDFFGQDLPRGASESDPSFRARISANVLRQRTTRAGIIATLKTLTGRTPVVFEPTRPLDTGAYNQGIMAYNRAGGYGSRALPTEAFVTAFRTTGDSPPVSDAAIYAAIAAAKPLGTTVWTAISD